MTPPAFSSASVNGAALTLTFDGGLDTASVPAAGAFTVKVGGTAVDLADTIPVAVSGSTATLTLAAALLSTASGVTVSYAAPTTGNKLQDADNGKNAVPDFADKAVTNDTPPDTTAPAVSRTASVNGGTLTLTFNEALDETSVPSEQTFKISLGTSRATAVDAVAIAGTTVTLTLTAAQTPRHGQRLRVQYVPGVTRLKDLSGNEVGNILLDHITITNVTPPAFSSASVNGATLTVTFDGGLDTASVPAAGAFTVKVGGTAVDLADTIPVAVSGSTATLTLAAALLSTASGVTVSYAAPTTGNKLQDADNGKNAVPDFADKAVTNDTPPDTTAPAVSRTASVNGGTLTLTFNEALDETSVPSEQTFKISLGTSRATAVDAVAIAGTTVTLTLTAAQTPRHGQRLRVQYVPGVTRLKDLSGNEVGNILLDHITITNVTPPAFSSASVNGATLTVTFDGGLDTASVPDGSAFTVKVGGTAVDLADTSPVAVSGSTATLTLAAALLSTASGVTVSYAAPTTGDKLQDADNGKNAVPDFADKAVTNNTPADTTGPAFVSATMNGAKLVITFDEALDETVVAAPSEFQSARDGEIIPASALAVSLSGRTATVTFDAVRAASHGQSVKVWYFQSINTAKRLKDLLGNEAPAFSGKTATNVTPPAFSSASVNGAALTLTFNGDLDTDSVPAGSAFTVKVGGTAVDLADTSPVAVSGSTATLTLAAPVLSTATLTVSYAAPATGNKLQNADDGKNAVANFTDKAVTNNTPADTAGPAFVSATMNGSKLVVTFDEALDETVVAAPSEFQSARDGEIIPASALAVSLSGRTATVTFDAVRAASHGQSVKVWYFQSINTAKRLKDLLGNEAPAFSGKTATNVTPPAFSSASVNGAALTLTFNGGLDTDSVPAAGAFTVKVGGTAVSLADTSPVAVSGSTATLTLAEALLSTATGVTVSYAAPSTGNKLQDDDGEKNAVPDFTDKTVTNATPADTTAPAFVSASMSGTTLTVIFDEALATAGATGNVSNNLFRVSHGGSGHESTGLTISGRTATATFAAAGAPGPGERVTSLLYEASATAADRLADRSGNAIAVDATTRLAILSATVVNATPPVLHATTLPSVNGAALTLTFVGSLDESSVPAGSAFTVKAGGTAVSLADTSPVAVSGSTVTLTLAAAVRNGQTVTVSYAAPATGSKLQGASPGLGPVADFTDRAVTNATPAAGLSDATLAEASVSGAALTLTFSKALGTASAPAAAAFTVKADGTAVALASSGAVAVSGKTVTLALSVAVTPGLAVTVSYDRAQAGSAPLFDGAGDDVASFVNEDAANATPAPEVRIVSVAVEARPTADSDGDDTAETLGAGSSIWVRVTWSADVVWDASAPRAKLWVGLDLDQTGGSKVTKKASLLRGVATSGRARSLLFRYTVVAGDNDTDGFTLARTAANDLVVLEGGATLEDAQGRDAARDSALGAGTVNVPVRGTLSASTDTAPPELLLASARGKTVTLTFDEDLEVPGAVARNALRYVFFISGARYQGAPVANQSPNRVEVAGPVVRLILGQAIPTGTEVSVNYYPQGLTGDQEAHRLKDKARNEVEPLYNVAADNTAAAGQRLAPARATVEGDTLTLFFDRGLDPGSVPDGSRFRVHGGRDIDASGTGTARIRGKRVIVTLEKPYDAVEAVFVDYARGDDANPLHSAAGRRVGDFRNLLVRALGGDAGPALTTGSVSGKQVTLYFSEALDESSAPEDGAIEVQVPRSGTPTWEEVAGDKVTVRGNGVFFEHGDGTVLQQTPTHARYTRPTQADAAHLRDVAGNEARSGTSLGAPLVDEGTTAPTAKPALVSALVTDDLVALSFDRPLDPSHVPPLAAFELSTNAFGQLLDVGMSGKSVTLRLATDVQFCDTLSLTYEKPVRGALRDRWGWQPDGFSNQEVTNTRAPTDCVKWPGSDEGSVNLRAERPLARDSEFRKDWFAVSASGGPVAVTGAVLPPDDPHALKLTVSREFGPDETVTVSYTRPPGERGVFDVDGRQFANAVDLPVKRRAGAPSVESVAVTSDAGSDDTYALGERVRVTLTFSEAVDVDTGGGTPHLTVDLDPAEWGAKEAAYEGGGGTESLTFVHTVAEPNVSTEGIAVLADTLALNGGTIRSAATEMDAALAHDGLAHDPAHKVDWRLAPAAPAVTGVAVTSDAGGDGTYALGERVRVTVTFDEAVAVDAAGGTPALAIDLDPGDWGTKQAAYESGGGTAELVFAHEVVEPNLSTAGIAVLANTLAMNGGAIRSVAAGADAALAHDGLDHDPAHKVDWRLSPAPPSVTGVEVTSEAGADGVYTEGETVEAGVTFSEPVTVGTDGGTPTLALIADTRAGVGRILRAPWASGSGTARLVFAWTVTEAEGSVSAVRVAASGLKLDGGTVAGANGMAAVLGFGAAPEVTAASVADEPDGRWEAGDAVEAVLAFAEPVTVTGAPSVGLVMEGAVKRAAYAGGSGTDVLTFRYTPGDGDGPWTRAALAGDSLTVAGERGVEVQPRSLLHQAVVPIVP